MPRGSESLVGVEAEFAGIYTGFTNQANTRQLIRIGRVGELNSSVPRRPDLRQQLLVTVLLKN